MQPNCSAWRSVWPVRCSVSFSVSRGHSGTSSSRWRPLGVRRLGRSERHSLQSWPNKPRGATRVLRAGPNSTLTLVILGLALVGLPVAIPLSVLGALGGDHSWLQDLGVAVFVGLIAASQSLFLLVALSRWRLATSRGERIGACGFALVPVSLAAMAIVGAVTASKTSGPNLTSWVLVGCILLADSIALRINSTAVATVIDYRRLSVLEGYAASQIAWLDGPSLSRAGHGGARVGVN